MLERHLRDLRIARQRRSERIQVWIGPAVISNDWLYGKLMQMQWRMGLITVGILVQILKADHGKSSAPAHASDARYTMLKGRRKVDVDVTTGQGGTRSLRST